MFSFLAREFEGLFVSIERMPQAIRGPKFLFLQINFFSGAHVLVENDG
jgi:hypothetical protein